MRVQGQPVALLDPSTRLRGQKTYPEERERWRPFLAIAARSLQVGNITGERNAARRYLASWRERRRIVKRSSAVPRALDCHTISGP